MKTKSDEVLNIVRDIARETREALTILHNLRHWCGSDSKPSWEDVARMIEEAEKCLRNVAG